MPGIKHNSPAFLLVALLASMVLSAGARAMASSLADKTLSPSGMAGGEGGILELTYTPSPTTSSAPAQPKKGVKIPFEFVEGLMVCAIPTSSGKLRLVFDTGANATALLGKSRPIEIHIGGKSLRLVSAPLRTSTLGQVNKTLPPERRLEGILGEDVLVQFERVTVDYKSLEIEFYP